MSQRPPSQLGQQQHHQQQPARTLGQQILATAGLADFSTQSFMGVQNISAGSNINLQDAMARLAGTQIDQATLIQLIQQQQQAGNISNLQQQQSVILQGGERSGNVMGILGVSNLGIQMDSNSGLVLQGNNSTQGNAHLKQDGLNLSKGMALNMNLSQESQWRPQLAHSSPILSPSQSGQQGTAGVSTSGQQQPAGKTKQRARRGQATDPHSIAERLRRERIADRMKSLQELVPNSTRVDKASMLDDIIEYVRFLQLQAKVLNLSRLNGAAAEAVRELLEELEAEASGKGEQAENNYSATEIRHMERQVALLLETDMGSAMQYLQSKGLCLMPVGLTESPAKKKPTSHVAQVVTVKEEPPCEEQDFQSFEMSLREKETGHESHEAI